MNVGFIGLGKSQPSSFTRLRSVPELSRRARLNLALSNARQMGLALPNTATAQELFNACAAHGGSAWDHSAMVRALELMSNFKVGQKAA